MAVHRLEGKDVFSFRHLAVIEEQVGALASIRMEYFWRNAFLRVDYPRVPDWTGTRW